jgi:hypothetical protein
VPIVRLVPPAYRWPVRSKIIKGYRGGRPARRGLAVGAPFEARVGLVLERPTLGLELVLRFDTLLAQRILVSNGAFDPTFACDERLLRQRPAAAVRGVRAPATMEGGPGVSRCVPVGRGSGA